MKRRSFLGMLAGLLGMFAGRKGSASVRHINGVSPPEHGTVTVDWNGVPQSDVPIVLSIAGDPSLGVYDPGPVSVAARGLDLAWHKYGLPYMASIGRVFGAADSVNEFYRRLGDVRQPKTVEISWFVGYPGTEDFPKEIHGAVVLAVRNMTTAADNRASWDGVSIAFTRYTMPTDRKPKWSINA